MKERERKPNHKMAILNLTISIITLNVNGLNILIKTGVIGQSRLQRNPVSPHPQKRQVSEWFKEDPAAHYTKVIIASKNKVIQLYSESHVN